MQEWSDFYVATAGAAAALAGLLFIGISINLSKILSYPSLPTRASLSLILLLSVLLYSILLLIPKETIVTSGYIVFLSCLGMWLLVSWGDWKVYKVVDTVNRQKALWGCLMDQVAIIPYFVGGWLLILNSENGFYWIAAAFLICFMKAFLDGWVLLIEIMR